MKNVLKDLNLHFTDDEIHTRMLAIHGATKALMIAKTNNQVSANLEAIYSLIIRIALTEFTIHKKKIEKILNLTTAIIQAGTFSQNLADKIKP